MIHILHMEAMKGGGRVNIGGEDDSIDGMQCIDHPYRNNPGGICAFCLQEKLGKLVSSSFPLPIHAVSSSSSSPSFRSDIAPSSSSTSTTRHCPPSSINTVSATTAVTSSSSLSLSVCPTKNENHGKHYHHEYYSRKTRIPFLLAKRKKKKTSVSASVSGSATSSNIILKRSKSTATPRRGSNSMVDADDEYFSPRKRNGFWSFLYHSSKSSTSSSSKSLNSKSFNNATASAKLKEKCCSGSSLGRKNDIVIVEEEDNSPNSSSNNNNNTGSFERKVSRSRSVGCGSRSFSGDFFERISTGFGDCTLRRVESQREGKSKGVVASSNGIASVNRAQDHHHHHHCMKERVLRRCGGIFSGFMMTSSSSSNSSTSSYWVSSNSADDAVNGGGKQGSVTVSQNRGGKSWGWAFASPMRAFSSKGSSKENHQNNRRDIIRDANDNNKNATPNLSAMPSLLSARG